MCYLDERYLSGDAKIPHLVIPESVDEQIRRLDISVDDIILLAIIERRADVDAQFTDLRHAHKGLLGLIPASQHLFRLPEDILEAFQKLHADEKPGKAAAAGILQVIAVFYGNDVRRSAQNLHNPDLRENGFRRSRIAEIVVDNLDDLKRRLRADSRIVDLVDLEHVAVGPSSEPGDNMPSGPERLQFFLDYPAFIIKVCHLSFHLVHLTRRVPIESTTVLPQLAQKIYLYQKL